jgi:hypothetical protein
MIALTGSGAGTVPAGAGRRFGRGFGRSFGLGSRR